MASQNFMVLVIGPLCDILNALAREEGGPKRKKKFEELAWYMGFECPHTFEAVIGALARAPHDRGLKRKLERMRAAATVRNYHGLAPGTEAHDFATDWFGQYYDEPNVTDNISATIRMVVTAVHNSGGKPVRTNVSWSDNACLLKGILERDGG